MPTISPFNEHKLKSLTLGLLQRECVNRREQPPTIAVHRVGDENGAERRRRRFKRIQTALLPSDLTSTISHVATTANHRLPS
ncbi:uncharacterized protein G2W53_004648 [Senna tora]|uniref:Uncharacterized protein n=1 Tax=Senna tora TaxID=362788 RepID=A0A834XC12_9FABA|nr:uncharacterized protein G2W53_004648 [Senna tora]